MIIDDVTVTRPVDHPKMILLEIVVKRSVTLEHFRHASGTSDSVGLSQWWGSCPKVDGN